jgi:hypothetical protein
VQVPGIEKRRPVEATERPDMIGVQMRRHDRHRQRGQRAYDRDNVALASARVEQHRAVGPKDEIAVVALVVARLTNRIRSRVDRLDDEIGVEPAPLDRLPRVRPDQCVVLPQLVLSAQVRRADAGGEQQQQ